MVAVLFAYAGPITPYEVLGDINLRLYSVLLRRVLIPLYFKFMILVCLDMADERIYRVLLTGLRTFAFSFTSCFRFFLKRMALMVHVAFTIFGIRPIDFGLLSALELELGLLIWF